MHHHLKPWMSTGTLGSPPFVAPLPADVGEKEKGPLLFFSQVVSMAGRAAAAEGLLEHGRRGPNDDTNDDNTSTVTTTTTK